MKTIHSILLLSVIGAVLSQSGATANTLCNTNMIQKLISAPEAKGRKESNDEPDLEDVTVFSSPQSTGFDETKVCGSYWKAQGGTCCDQATLEKRIKSTVKKLKKRAINRRGVFANGKAKGLRLIDKLKELIANRSTAMKSGANAVTDATIAEWNAALDNLKGGDSLDDTRENKAKDMLGACLKQIVEDRVKTWCTACAASDSALISAVWDDTNSQIKVHESTCKAVVEKCAPVIAFIKRVRQVDLIARAIRKALGKDDPQAPASGNPEPTAEQDADTACGDNATACKDNATQRAAFCQKISFNKDDAKVWGDGKLMKNNVENMPKNRRILAGLAEVERILQSSDTSYGYPAESGTSGMDTTTLNANFQVSSGEMGGESSGRVIAAFSVITFLLSVAFMN